MSEAERVSELRQGEPRPSMALILLILLLILILGGIGIWVVKFLLWIALILLALWLLGFFVRAAEGARWYRW
jgi:hypothetical protein